MTRYDLTRWLVSFDGTPTLAARAGIAVLVAAAFLGGFVARASTHEDDAAPVTAAAIASDASAAKAAALTPVRLGAAARVPALRGARRPARAARPGPATTPPAEAQLVEQPSPTPTPTAAPAPTAVPAPPARPAPPPPPPPTGDTFDSSG